MKKEGLGSRAGFILVCAGCAIGLGNVWRFPYTVGKYGGALFLILYLVLLAAFALPIMVMEFAVGRASGENVAGAFVRLAPGWCGGRAFGMGSMGIFASHIGKDKRLAGEAVLVALLDTFVAVAAGLAVIPACFAARESPGAGPGLIFRTLPHVFNSMSAGRVWGSLFFLFMVFAAMSTVIGVSENITAFGMGTFGMTRAKSCAVNAAAVALLSLPCAFGYNILSFIAPLGAGTTILDLEDFIVSGNILPLGSLVYVLFCTGRRGWGWGNFVREANTGEGLAFPRGLRVYCSVILPALLLILWVQGYISLFLT